MPGDVRSFADTHCCSPPTCAHKPDCSEGVWHDADERSTSAHGTLQSPNELRHPMSLDGPVVSDPGIRTSESTVAAPPIAALKAGISTTRCRSDGSRLFETELLSQSRRFTAEPGQEG